MTTTIIGNLTGPPELRFGKGSGASWCTFTVAENRKPKDGPETSTFIDCKAFGDLADNIAASLDKGMRVIVTGRLETETWERDGAKRSKLVLLVDGIGPDLRFATASVTRTSRVMSGSGRMQSVTPTPDPWGAPEPVEPPREEPW